MLAAPAFAAQADAAAPLLPSSASAAQLFQLPALLAAAAPAEALQLLPATSVHPPLVSASAWGTDDCLPTTRCKSDTASVHNGCTASCMAQGWGRPQQAVRQSLEHLH